MNEQWALDAIKRGEIEVEGEVYKIRKSPTGSCLGCCFYPNNCNNVPKVVTVCCSGGGNILIKQQQNK